MEQENALVLDNLNGGRKMPQEGTVLYPKPAGIRESFQAAGTPEESMIEIVIRILTVLASRKWLILGITALLMTFSAITVALISDRFRAVAVLLPPQPPQSSLASFMSGSYGGLAGQNIAAQLGLKDPADLYIGILKSRTIAEHVVERFHLREMYRLKLLSDTRAALMKHVSFTKSKESFIIVSVDDHDPKLAAALANAFVDELYKMNSQLAITDAAYRRLFFERELGKEKDALSQAEALLKTSQLKSGLIVPAGQAESLVRSAAQLRAEISSREVTLQAVRSYATDQNSQVEVLQREIAAMRAQLVQLKSSGQAGSDFEMSAGQLPQASLEYLRKTRDLRYHEALYELLAKQYEAARIDEAKQAPVLQILDPATVPEKKAGPFRLTVVLMVGLLTIVLTSIWAYASAVTRAQLSLPQQAAKVASLRAALRFS